jgi:hypothetical protein
VRGRILVFAALIATPGTARAGRSFYGWLFGSEVMPERGAEIQTFVDEENLKSHEDNARETHWWVSPFIGITDQIEIGLPVEIMWSRTDAPMSAKTNLYNYGAELRWRLVSQDPVDKPAFAPLVRVALKRIVTGPRDVWQPELDVVGSYDTGGIQVLGDLGMVGAVGPDAQEFEVAPGAGISIKAYDELRLGAEVFARIPLSDTDQTWAAIGPNLAWSHGRSWISAAYGIGLYHIRDAPRLNWGIAF